MVIKLKDILEGTCGYGLDGELGDEPAGPHLLNKEAVDEGIPNYFRGYFDNVNNNLDRLEKNVKQLIKDLGKDGLKKESLEIASLYKKHIIEFKVKLKDFERKNRD
jgi:hypothetical protein